jgi:O-antigen/teichoic acid export membrane protein
VTKDRSGGRDSAHVSGRLFLIETSFNAAAFSVLKMRGFLMIWLLTYFAGIAAYGVWTQVQVLANLLAPIVGLGLANAAVRFYLEANGDLKRRQLFWSGALALGVTTPLCAVVIVVLSPYLAEIFGTGDPTPFQLGALLVAGTTWRHYLTSWLRAGNEVNTASRWFATGELLDLGLSASLLAATHSVNGALMGSAAANIIVCGALLMSRRESLGRPVFDGRGLRRRLRYSLPIVPLTLGDETLARSDRLIVGAVLGPAAAGVYGAIYAVASTATIVLAPLSTVFFPKQVRLAQSDRGAAHDWLRRIIAGWCAVIVAQLSVLLIVGPYLVDILLSDQGGAGDENIRLLLGLSTIGVGLYGVARLLGHVFLLDKRTGTLAGVWAIASVFSVGLNLIAVPSLGLDGAALTTVLTYSMVVAAQLMIARRPARRAVSELSPA